MTRTLALGLVVALAGACGAARVIARTPAGGVIELQGDRHKAMEQAHYEMFAHCGPGNFTINYEGEEPTGTDPVQTDNTEPDNDVAYSGRTTTTTTTATAWRIHYTCGHQGAPSDPSVSPGGH